MTRDLEKRVQALEASRPRIRHGLSYEARRTLTVARAATIAAHLGEWVPGADAREALDLGIAKVNAWRRQAALAPDEREEFQEAHFEALRVCGADCLRPWREQLTAGFQRIGGQRDELGRELYDLLERRPGLSIDATGN